MTYPTENDLNDLPWIEMTQSTPWNPSLFDGECPSITHKMGPNFVMKSRNETVLLEIKRRQEMVFSDTLCGDINDWRRYRNWEEEWGDID